MILDELKEREKELIKAHTICSQQCKALEQKLEVMLNQRIKIVGAIEENQYQQKRLAETNPD